MTCLMTPVRLPKLSRIVNVIRKALFAFNAAKASMKNAAEKQKPKDRSQKINPKKKYFIFYNTNKIAEPIKAVETESKS